MCTFRDEHSVVVCDVAIGRVRQAVDQAFYGRVRYTPIEGQGTLVEAAPDIDQGRFTAVARAAIAAAQTGDPSGAAGER